MGTNVDLERQSIVIYDGTISYIRLDTQPTQTSSSSIVLSNCSSINENDDENNDGAIDRDRPTLRWKRQKIFNDNPSPM